MSKPSTWIRNVISVLILMCIVLLLLPRGGCRDKHSRVAEVRSELGKIESALIQFKARFGVEAPSSIRLFKDPASWHKDEDGLRSRGVLRPIWPMMNFAHDFEFLQADEVSLDGAECLVFFLGGRFDPNSKTMVGFSKNPIDPMSLGGNRVGPFFEFRPERLVDADQDGFPEYLSPIQGSTKPYLYFHSQSDVKASIGNYMPDAYRAEPGGNAQLGNRNSYQLICAGFDDEYGSGGFFDLEKMTLGAEHDAADEDNITNFAPVTLKAESQWAFNGWFGLLLDVIITAVLVSLPFVWLASIFISLRGVWRYSRRR